MTKKITILDLGRTCYGSSLFTQEKIVEKKFKDKIFPDVLIYTEHEPVITLGKRGGEEFINKSSKYFMENSPEIIQTGRGGLVTCHMPGQAVLYPILDLGKHKIGVKDYSYLLMDVITDFLLKYNVESEQTRKYPGVWVNSRKIGSIGLGIRKNICFHGLSINIINEKSLFDIVTPCGIKDAHMTRLCDETDIEIDMNTAKKKLVNSFLKVFDFESDKYEISL